MSTWFTIDEDDTEATDRLVAAWPDAPLENVETFGYILSIARDQVWAFAPESKGATLPAVPLPGGPALDVPDRLVYAQLKQAENLWNAGRVNSAGDIGPDGGYSYTPRPLDKTIRGIIRPIIGAFSVG